jgi:hypothetical protein
MAGADGTGGEPRVPQTSTAGVGSSAMDAATPPKGVASVTTATDANGPGSEGRNTGGKGGRGNA